MALYRFRQEQKLVVAYRELLKVLSECGYLDGTVIYPYAGPDVFPSLFAETHRLNKSRKIAYDYDGLYDFDRGKTIVHRLFKKDTPGMLEIIYKNTLGEKELDARELKNYEKIRSQIKGPAILFLKGFWQWSREETNSQLQEIHNTIFREVLQKDDRIIILDKKDLALLPRIKNAGFEIVEDYEIDIPLIGEEDDFLNIPFVLIYQSASLTL
ncbi:unnamed protein product [marine sediment metagenome]|uniref:Uncharacterized protein n=1 Tax=marine sediment metagenome TaxID=412755 RepID=X1RZK3_9ZZZZ